MHCKTCRWCFHKDATDGHCHLQSPVPILATINGIEQIVAAWPLVRLDLPHQWCSHHERRWPWMKKHESVAS